MPDDTEFSLDDPPPSAEETARYALLTEAQRRQIDALLVKSASDQWQKMARLVASAMGEVTPDLSDVSHSYFAERLRYFVAAGQLEARGKSSVMRYCELPLRKLSGRET